MADESVLLINLPPEEIRYIQELLSHFDFDIGATAVPTLEDAVPHVKRSDLLLVIVRASEHHRRPDQEVHRLRRLMARSVPLLVLVPPDHGTKVKEYLRAGADEYWLLPLDSTVFPPRLHVLLELGQSAMSGQLALLEKRRLSGPTKPSLFTRVYYTLRNLFASYSSKRTTPLELTPRIANKWKKISRLGFGSYGEVWLVKDESSATLSVAKIPHTRHMNNKFIREAAILTRLAGHPNAVQLKDVVKEERKVILIQEYVEGSTLRELLDQGMDSMAKEKAFVELLDVVAYAHEQNIMHRDIKPENVIVTPSGVSKLLDFGTGKDLARRSTSSTVTGTRPFMAPEQILGESRLASDVWALGVMLYALSTGFLPFYDENEKKLMDFILECAPESPRSLEPALPPELEEVILNCLEKNWEDRYPNGVRLRAELLKIFPDFGKGKVLPQS